MTNLCPREERRQPKGFVYNSQYIYVRVKGATHSFMAPIQKDMTVQAMAYLAAHPSKIKPNKTCSISGNITYSVVVRGKQGGTAT